MRIKTTTSRAGKRGRPLKEESNAIRAEKAMLDYKSGIIDMMDEARKTLHTLLTASNSSDKVKEGVAKFIIEEGKAMYQEYLDEDEESEKENVSESGKTPTASPKPFTTDIIPLTKAQ